MTQNKETIATYMDGFRKSDHELILSCLTDDIEWELPGIFHIFGKESFDKEIENEAFVGRPTIIVTRMIEENNVVVAEGKVTATKREGDIFNAVFCDVFEMKDMKINRIISYLNQI